MLQETVSSDRLGMFTASEISRLLKRGRGKDAYWGEGSLTYIREKIAEISTGERKPSAPAVSSAWGIENEKDAVMWFSQQTGIEVKYFGAENPKFFEYNEISGASPDGLTQDAGVETKCAYVSANHVEYLLLSKDPAERQQWLKENRFEYYCQCVFQMMACKRDKWYFVSYDPRQIEHWNRMAVIVLHQDEELEAEIKERLDAAKVIVSDAIAMLGELPTPSVLLATAGDGAIILQKG